MITQNHSRPMRPTAPATEGNTIRWAQHYDLVVKCLTTLVVLRTRQSNVDCVLTCHMTSHGSSSPYLHTARA
jgi:hypothetical protein